MHDKIQETDMSHLYHAHISIDKQQFPVSGGNPIVKNDKLCRECFLNHKYFYIVMENATK